MRLRAQIALRKALFAFAVLVIASYLVYAVFDDWSYLRFLLPAMAVFAIFAAVELSRGSIDGRSLSRAVAVRAACSA